jgi:DDE superfamily endonuclease/Archaeal putative transposase ISC1217
MSATPSRTIPIALCEWITFLARSLPPRAVRTFLELLIGAMITRSGFVTQTWVNLDMQKHWTTYYKFLQKGKWSWVRLARVFFQLILSQIKDNQIVIIIDDTLVLRSTPRAPASKIHHQHGNKPNLAKYVQGQCWVTLAVLSQRAEGQSIAIPVVSRLMPNTGNSGKLRAAQTLMRSVLGLISNKSVRLLIDSWYMRGNFISAMLARNVEVIGQVRHDTRLYDFPLKRKAGQRGRPAVYGEKITAIHVEKMQSKQTTLRLYGKEQEIRYRSKILLARFLKGLPVHAVWCEFSDGKGGWRKTRLLLATNINLSAEEVISGYEKRWSIETAFHDLKQSWGMKEAWQQTRLTLNRWVQLITVGYGLVQLLSIKPIDELSGIMTAHPWRDDRIVTAGKIRDGLAKQLMHVNILSWWSMTLKKFAPPG